MFVFKVEVKPYVLDDQHCDICQGSRCGGKFAPFFCANVACLQVGVLLLDASCLLRNYVGCCSIIASIAGV